MDENLISETEIEILEKLKDLPLNSDEDYQQLGEIFDDDE